MSRLRHDIDNHIHVALGNAELLLLDELSPSARAALEDINSALTSVRRLLDEAFPAVGPDDST